MKKTPAKVLARHLGVSESRVRHQRTDDQNGALTTVLALISDPDVDAAAIITSVLEAWEDRFLTAPEADLRARLARLRERDEHVLEAAQNAATVIMAPNRSDTYRDHAAGLLEMAMLTDMLEQEAA